MWDEVGCGTRSWKATPLVGELFFVAVQGRWVGRKKSTLTQDAEANCQQECRDAARLLWLPPETTQQPWVSSCGTRVALGHPEWHWGKGANLERFVGSELLEANRRENTSRLGGGAAASMRPRQSSCHHPSEVWCIPLAWLGRICKETLGR